MGDHLIKLEEGRIVPLDENILEGRLLDSEREYRVFRSNGVDILCPDMDGAFTKAVIDYDQILLSRELLDSSAQNNFRGTVELLSEEASHHGLTDVRVKTDGLSLTSRITNRSVKKLSLEPGREIYLSFKASSVRLY
jgi:molybdopterin-binding protein